MTCEPIEDKDGRVVGIVCCRDKRAARCSVPGCDRYATALCDWPTRSASGTCDKRLCRGHATNVGDDRDYCPAHAKRHHQQPGLFP